MKIENPNATTVARYPSGAVEKLNALAAAAGMKPGEYFDFLMDREFQKAEAFIIQSRKLAAEMREFERTLA